MADSTSKSNYTHLLKSTGILGFSQVIAIAITMIRTKLLAYLLGAEGYGIISIYNRLIELVGATCTAGVNMGGVRELADRKSRNELDEIDKIISLIRFWIIFSSSIVIIIFIFAAKHISYLQFGTEAYSTKVIIIGFAALFTNFYNISLSFLSGLREVKKTAKSQILAAVWGLVLALPIIYFFREDGIEWSILIVAMANAGVMMYFTKKLNIHWNLPGKEETKIKVRAIFKVAMSYAVPGILASIFLYLTGIYLQKEFDLATMGIYQACIVLSTVYIQLLIKAMSTDYFPSLMTCKDDNAAFNRKIAEQIEFGVAAAAIGVFATYIFAPYILQLFYTKSFVVGTDILRWQIIAVFLRMMEFPLGFATTAKGKNLHYLIIQSVYIILEFAVLVLFTKLFGTNGLGICYFVSYFVFFIFRYFSVNHYSGFKLTTLLKKQLLVIASLLTVMITTTLMLTTLIATLLNSLVLIGLIAWTYRMLRHDMHIEPFQLLRKLIATKKDRNE